MRANVEALAPPVVGDNGHSLAVPLDNIIALEQAPKEAPRDLEALGVMMSRSFRDGIVLHNEAPHRKYNPKPGAENVSLRILEPSRLIIDGDLRVVEDPDERFVLNMFLNNRGIGLKAIDFILSPHFAPDIVTNRHDRAVHFRGVLKRFERQIHPDFIQGVGNKKARMYDLGLGVLVDTRTRAPSDRALIQQIVEDYVRGDTLVAPRFLPSAWADARIALSKLVGDKTLPVGSASRFSYVQHLLTSPPERFVLHEGHIDFIARLARGKDLREQFSSAACLGAEPERFHINIRPGKGGREAALETAEDTIARYCGSCIIREQCLEFGVRTTGTNYSDGGIRIYGGVIFGTSTRNNAINPLLTAVVERINEADEAAAAEAEKQAAERQAAQDAADAEKEARIEAVRVRITALK